jgi:phosphatidylserine/phosphatidylglycerophosphate/cardiolipin synthase-like enzyme
MRTKVLCGGNEIRQALASALNLMRKPKRVRILCLTIEDVEILNDVRVSEMLLKLLTRDVVVTIIVGEKPGKKKRRFFRKLYEFGANLHYNEKVHAKVVLMEGKKEKLAVIMSANITTGGLHYKHEVGVLLFNLTEFKYEKLRNYSNSILGADETRWLLHVV